MIATASVGVNAWSAKGHLQQAEALVTVAKSQVSEGDYAALPGTFDQIHRHTTKARSLMGGRLWSMAEHLPKLGPNLITLREWIVVTHCRAEADTMADRVQDMSSGRLVLDAGPTRDPSTPVP